VIGGRISKTSEIKVSTPSASLGIRGGIMAFNVGTDSTTAVKIFGHTMTITANGITQTVTVNGQGVATVSGGTPGAASFLVGGNLLAALNALDNAATSSAATTLIVAAINSARGGATLQNIISAVISQTAQAVKDTATSMPGYAAASDITRSFTAVVVENSNQTSGSPH
jgi:hypothetical protein